jgi:hypothetical protein
MAQPIRGWAVRAKQNTWFIALAHRSLLVRDVPRPNRNVRVHSSFLHPPLPPLDASLRASTYPRT